MNIWWSFLISLLLTTIVGFTFPMVICGVMLISLAIAAHLPEIAAVGEIGYANVWDFLTVFGNGSGSGGILTLGLTFGTAGFLFEALNFYRYQILVNQPIVAKIGAEKSDRKN